MSVQTEIRLAPALAVCVVVLLMAAIRSESPAAEPLSTDAPTSPSSGISAAGAVLCSGQPPAFNASIAERLVNEALAAGDPHNGLELFCSAKLACLSCHRIGQEGGEVGPALTDIGKRRSPVEIAESVLWPNRVIPAEYEAWFVLTADGKAYQGYKRLEDETQLRLHDASSQKEVLIPKADIEQSNAVGSLMPENLVAGLTPVEQRDLLRFLIELRPHGELLDAVARRRQPAEFPYDRKPLRPERWPHWQYPVNRDRVYDFYAKQAAYFRTRRRPGQLLPAFPGLDGGNYGHWGNQDETYWRDNRWNEIDLGTLLAGVFHGPQGPVTKAVCVRLGDEGELSACFNPQTLRYEALWQGDFLAFSDVRHGFLDGLRPAGKLVPLPQLEAFGEPGVYRGFYRFGKRVIFAYQQGGREIWDAPWVENGKFVRMVAPASQHPLRRVLSGGPPQWPQTFIVRGQLGTQRPYSIDTIPPPTENPWKAPLFCGDHAFLSHGSALVCTMHGDVWKAEGLDDRLERITWRRFASGLHQPLGIVVHEDVPYVLGRDQVTRLHDFNRDGEADFYECYSNSIITSPSGHDYICGLARDEHGAFYTASSNQGLIRIPPDGAPVEVLATGLRNPDGIHLTPDGSLLAPASEGEWTPASMVCMVRRPSDEGSPPEPVHFGYGGPKDGKPPALPLVYLPRGLDNSSGGQVSIPDDRWGPLAGKMVHLSYGAARHFLLLRDQVQGVFQGAVVPLVGDLRSGVHRGKFNPIDGQLYVTGMDGWGSYAVDDGCFQRIRYTGDRVQLPASFHVHENGVLISFTEPIDPEIASNPALHFAQAWNYRYGQSYGSPEFSPRRPGIIGHDQVQISAAHVADDRTLFIEILELQPVNVLHLALSIESGDVQQIFITVHKLDAPYSALPSGIPSSKTIAPHPQQLDMASLLEPKPNPWRAPINDARLLEVSVGKNLSFSPLTLRAVAGESIQLRLNNPDVVPHNWVLIKPGKLADVGQLTNRLVADPGAAFQHYVPQTEAVIVHTNVIAAGESTSIYFDAPMNPGRYPFLCTFPGHWMVMNGELVVEAQQTPTAPE